MSICERRLCLSNTAEAVQSRSMVVLMIFYMAQPRFQKRFFSSKIFFFLVRNHEEVTRATFSVSLSTDIPLPLSAANVYMLVGSQSYSKFTPINN